MKYHLSALLSTLTAMAMIQESGQTQDPSRPMKVTLRASLSAKGPPLQVARRRVEIENKQFGLIAAVRHNGVPRFTKFELNGRDELRWVIPAEFCDGSAMSWFLVQGMESEEDVAKFFGEPEKWTWGMVVLALRRGVHSKTAELCERGTPIWCRGRIVGPGGKPVHGMATRVRGISSERPTARLSLPGTFVGFDPESGRVWVQGLQAIEGVTPILDIRHTGPLGAEVLDHLIGNQSRSWNGLAAVYGHPLVKGERLRIRLLAESILEGSILGPRLKSAYALYARFMPVGQPVHGRSTIVGSKFWIRGLKAGIYDLNITSRSPNQVLIEKKGLVVEEGQTLKFAEPLDVQSQLLSVKLSIVDPDGRDLNANVDQIFPGARPGVMPGLPLRARNGPPPTKGGVAERVVTKQGGDFAVHLEGYAPRILTGVLSDMRVVMHRLSAVQLRLSGLPAGACESGRLVLRAEPPDGYSRLSWRVLRTLWLQYKTVPGGPRGRMVRSRRDAWGGYCQSKIVDGKPVTLRLIQPGKWRFSLLVLRSPESRFASQNVSFVLPDILEIPKGSKEVELTVPPDVAKRIADSIQN